MSAKAFTWSFSTKLLELMTGIVLLIYVARSLTLTELGVLATFGVFSGLANILSNMGFFDAVVRDPDLCDHDVLHSLSIASASMGLTITLVAFIFYPIIFHEIEAGVMLLFLAMLPSIIAAFRSVYHAMIIRELEFRLLFYVRATALAVLLVVTLLLLSLQFGIFAVLLANISFELVLLIAYVNYSNLGIPSSFSLKGVATVARFSLILTFGKLINYGFKQADRIVIGRSIGLDTLGLYSRPMDLMYKALEFLSGSVISVLFPKLARRSDQDEILGFKLLVVWSLIFGSLATIIAVVFDDIVVLLLGDKFADVSAFTPVIGLCFFWLAVGNFLSMLHKIRGSVFSILLSQCSNVGVFAAGVFSSGDTLTIHKVVQILSVSLGVGTLVLGCSFFFSV